MSENIIYAPELSKDFEDEPSMGHLLFKSLSNAGDKVLLVSGISGEEATARQILDECKAVAKGLSALGIKSGDVISIVSENRFEFVYTLFGSLLLNVTIAPINLTYSEREMKHAFSLSKPKIIFCSPFASEKVVSVAKSLSYVNKVVLFDDENEFGSSVTLFDDFKKNAANFPDIIPRTCNRDKTVSYILCSSGTTGENF
jgi:long-subunit acyl-CoA synthetase (AMP-forming)